MASSKYPTTLKLSLNSCGLILVLFQDIIMHSFKTNGIFFMFSNAEYWLIIITQQNLKDQKTLRKKSLSDF